MSVARFVSVLLAGAGAAGVLTAVTAQPAAAAVVPSSCSYSYGFTRVAATCYDTDSTPWYLRIECADTRGRDHQINGTVSYGSGTSLAQCPVATQVDAIDGPISL